MVQLNALAAPTALFALAALLAAPMPLQAALVVRLSVQTPALGHDMRGNVDGTAPIAIVQDSLAHGLAPSAVGPPAAAPLPYCG